MKKFLRRLKPSSPPSSSASSYTSPPLYESPISHQLSSVRDLPSSPPAAPPSSTLFVADELPELMCATCAGSQFPELLAWKPGERRPWVSLSHVLPGRGQYLKKKKNEVTPAGETGENGEAEGGDEPRCPYCAFFRALIGGGHGRETNGTFAPYLRIRRGFERLGIPEKHDLGGEVLVEVMGRNKRLPWGYIIRAADDEGTSMQGYLSDEPEIRGRIISQQLSMDLVRLWLDYCVEHHLDPNRGCLRRRGLPEGMRLVDVGRRRVVRVDEVEGIAPDYLSLSYVSAEEEAWDDVLVDDVLPDDISPLISDALEFTTNLGFEYIYIDRYCQPPPPLQQTDIDDIFAQSALTLIIPTPSLGIPGLSLPRTAQLSLHNETGLYTTTLLRPDLAIANSAWQKQKEREGLMARRRLVFFEGQVYWQCQTGCCTEAWSVPCKWMGDVNLGRCFPEVGSGLGEVLVELGMGEREGGLDEAKAALEEEREEDVLQEAKVDAVPGGIHIDSGIEGTR